MVQLFQAYLRNHISIITLAKIFNKFNWMQIAFWFNVVWPKTIYTIENTTYMSTWGVTYQWIIWHLLLGTFRADFERPSQLGLFLPLCKIWVHTAKRKTLPVIWDTHIQTMSFPKITKVMSTKNRQRQATNPKVCYTTMWFYTSLFCQFYSIVWYTDI